jgi:hypothetical protein
VRLIVTDNFAICDLSAIGYVLDFNGKTGVGALNVADTLEESVHLVYQILFSKEAGVLGLS